MSRREQDTDPQPEARPATPSRIRRLREFFEKDLWEVESAENPTSRNGLIFLLRILSISWKGLTDNRLFSRAAALSYSSLIALGPLIAIVVMLSSSFVQTDAETQIKRALLFIAPSLEEMITLGQEEDQAEMATALDQLLAQIVAGAEDLLSQVNTSGSKAFGILGALILIWVVIQLLISVENTLNQIWGVHQGRPWSQRIVFYWTFVSLGALLGLGSTALFSASNLAGMTDWVPFGSEMSSLMLRFSPFLSFAMLVLLLTLFYRFFPNTTVAFRAALIGSLLTAVLLFLNNYLSILYVHRVISFQSLYGSVGIIPILMIGLYFFWVFILLGGQLTYAVENVRYMTNQSAWKRINPLAREMVTLATFLRIARRFHACEDAPTINDISRDLHVPVNILNESIEILEQLDWVTRITMEDSREDIERIGFRPAKPLAAYTLSRFRSAFEQVGQGGIINRLLKTDPLLKEYHKALQWHQSEPFFKGDLQAMLSNQKSTPARP
jgi:membrane protein